MRKLLNSRKENLKKASGLYRIDYLFKNSTILHRQYFESYKDVIEFLQSGESLNIDTAELRIKGINKDLPCSELTMVSSNEEGFIFKAPRKVDNEWVNTVINELKEGYFDKHNWDRLYTYVPCFSKDSDEVLVVGFGLDTIVDDEESKSVCLSYSTDYLKDGEIDCGDEECRILKKKFFNRNIKELLENLVYERIDAYYKGNENDLFKFSHPSINDYCQDSDWYAKEMENKSKSENKIRLTYTDEMKKQDLLVKTKNEDVETVKALFNQIINEAKEKGLEEYYCYVWQNENSSSGLNTCYCNVYETEDDYNMDETPVFKWVRYCGELIKSLEKLLNRNENKIKLTYSKEMKEQDLLYKTESEDFKTMESLFNQIINEAKKKGLKEYCCVWDNKDSCSGINTCYCNVYETEDDFHDGAEPIFDFECISTCIGLKKGLEKLLNRKDKQKIEVVTHCWVVTNYQDDIDFPENSECTTGDAIFSVPYEWLKNIVDNNSGQYGFDFSSKLTFNTPEEFEEWKETYSHGDGFIIFEKALKDNVLIGNPVVKNCDCCKENSIYK